MDYVELIKQSENEYLDFKQQWYDNNVDLVLDILSMANSDSSNDRYIVIGIEDKTKRPISVKNDHNRKNTENVMSVIKSSKFNIKPIVRVIPLTKGSIVLDIIEIKKTKNRPYFLLEDKKHAKKVIRAGVVYTRDGDSNTPIDSTASEYQISKMWEERFGLNLSPEERLNIYIKDKTNWKTIENGDQAYMYYKPFPEFTIGYLKETGQECAFEWSKSIGKSNKCLLFCKYHNTILKIINISSVDNSRHWIVDPDWVDIYYKADLSEVVANKFLGSPPQNYSIHDLCNSSVYLRKRIYYQVETSFEYFLQSLYNSDRSLKDFYYYHRNHPFQKIYIFKENDDITRLCKKIFIQAQTANF